MVRAALVSVIAVLSVSTGLGNGPQSKPVHSTAAFLGERAGQDRTVEAIVLSWCPAGSFTIGSPRTELERRPDEHRARASFLTGFWIGKYEIT